jgi:stage II sporulation SpoAA-like protein
MPITIMDAAGPIVSAKISGELDREEVSRIQAASIEAIQRCGKISALFILDNFRGWKREGDWGDITFMTERDSDIDKIAVVGDEQWRDFVYAFLAKGLRRAAVEYFLTVDLTKARAWLEADDPE